MDGEQKAHESVGPAYWKLVVVEEHEPTPLQRMKNLPSLYLNFLINYLSLLGQNWSNPLNNITQPGTLPSSFSSYQMGLPLAQCNFVP